MKLLILGGVAAGTKAAARAKREYPDASVTIVTQDDYVAYAGCGLPYFVGGIISEERELVVRTPDEFKLDNGIDVFTRHQAVKIDIDTHAVTVRDLSSNTDKIFDYDKLIIATGALPIIPALDGISLKRVFTVRGLNDAKKIRAMVDSGKVSKAVVIGGGFIGLEMAENLAHKGIKVSVIELKEQILPGYDADIAAIAKSAMVKKGVDIFTGEGVKKINGNTAGEAAAVVTSARIIDTDMVILSVGIKPNTGFAIEAGIAADKRGLIITDEYFHTNVPDILAVGDCASVKNRQSGHDTYSPMGSTANKTGRLVVANLFEKKASFAGVQGTAIVKLFDCNVARTGISEVDAIKAGFDIETVIVPTPDRAHYYPGNKPIITKLIADKETGKVLGASVVGIGVVDKPIDTIATGIAMGMTVSQLSMLDLAYTPPFASAMASSIVAANVMLNKLDGKLKGINPCKLDINDLNIQMIDVRTEGEFIINAIPNAVNIPFEELSQRLNEIDKNKPAVLICKVGRRAYSAYLQLQRMGYDNIAILDGGMSAWPFETV
jgi:NADPH-dependent 2,4-dienoyl-CoA reductase/sulfur reductase-like enzyme/rhodanese-related sulfurtransferase